jgi:hypothetical protein
VTETQENALIGFDVFECPLGTKLITSPHFQSASYFSGDQSTVTFGFVSKVLMVLTVCLGTNIAE